MSVTVFCGLALPARASAAEPHLDLREFGRLSIQNEGRVKPLDTYARSVLLQFSSRSSYHGASALEWLAGLLFRPEPAEGDTVFRINNEQTLKALGLDLPEARRYTYGDLAKGLPKLQQLVQGISQLEEKQRSPVDQELLRLNYNLGLYQSLAGSLRFSRKVETFAVGNGRLAGILGIKDDGKPHSYLEMLAAEDALKRNSAIAGIDTAGLGLDSAAAAGVAREADRLGKELFFWRKFSQDGELALIPPFAGGPQTYWTPWQILSGIGSAPPPEEIRRLADAAEAYRAGNQVEFDLALKNFGKIVSDRKTGELRGSHPDLELLYNRVQPFKTAKMLYLVSLLLVMASLIGRGKWAYRAALAFALAAVVPHAWGIVSRMIIMSRPPITSLFETFISVSWVTCMLGLATEWFQRNRLGLLISTLSATALLFISDKYAAEGDTLTTLVAVLNTNFWLSTHVVTISLGYAGCCAAGVAGHVYLIQRMAGAGRSALTGTAKAVYGILAFGLVFSFIGTVLGGIWADQSWGRFWGWDPKENGALLIVLWCSVLFHARMGGRIRELGLAAGSVLGITVVMFAWFGINLLGVGLHSYGFSSGVFFWFVLFIIVEILFLAISLYGFRKKQLPSG